MTETELQNQIVELAGLMGWCVNHVFPLRTKHGWRTATTWAGWPDLTLWRPPDGLTFLEVKGPTTKIDPAQQVTIELLGRCEGVTARIVRPDDWEWIQAHLTARPGSSPAA